jgi:hypothetical protein
MRWTKSCGISTLGPHLAIIALGGAITIDATTACTTMEIAAYTTVITTGARIVSAVCPRGNHSFVPQLLSAGTATATGYEQYSSRLGGRGESDDTGCTAASRTGPSVERTACSFKSDYTDLSFERTCNLPVIEFDAWLAPGAWALSRLTLRANHDREYRSRV